MMDELERFRALNEELDAKKALLIKRADQLINQRAREDMESREGSVRRTYREREAEREREVENRAEDGDGRDEIKERPSREGRRERRKDYEIEQPEAGRESEEVGEREERKESKRVSLPQSRERPPSEKKKQTPSRPSSHHDSHPSQYVKEERKEEERRKINQLYNRPAKEKTPQDDEVAVGQLGAEAGQRYLLAKLRVLKEELRASQVGSREKDAQLTELNVRYTELAERDSKITKANTSLESQLEKLTKTHSETSKKLSLLETQLSAYKKESDTAAKIAKNADQDKSAREARLHRALEEAERLKAALKEVQQEGREGQGAMRKKAERLEAECKRLERLNSDLLGIRKQMRLVDVLKRAKVHMEAVQLLGFSEAEFARTLELGDKL